MYHARAAWNNVILGDYGPALSALGGLGQEAWKGVEHVTSSWRRASRAAATTRDIADTVSDWWSVRKLRDTGAQRSEYAATVRNSMNHNQWNDSRTGSSVVPPSLRDVMRLTRRPRRRYRKRRYNMMRKVRRVPRRVSRRYH